MNEHFTKRNHLTTTLDLATELNKRQASQAERLPEPPKPGDIFLSRRTTDFPVEWLMIEENASGALVVPVDEHPYAGCHDLELAPESLGGASVVRCNLDASLETSELDPELRTGTLTEFELGRIRRKRNAIEMGTVEATLLEEIVDGDPEYHRWFETILRPALAAVTANAMDDGSEEPLTLTISTGPTPGTLRVLIKEASKITERRPSFDEANVSAMAYYLYTEGRRILHAKRATSTLKDHWPQRHGGRAPRPMQGFRKPPKAPAIPENISHVLIPYKDVLLLLLFQPQKNRRCGLTAILAAPDANTLIRHARVVVKQPPGKWARSLDGYVYLGTLADGRVQLVLEATHFTTKMISLEINL